MELNFIKKYIKVDFDDDDECILLLYDVAKEYIVGAIGQNALNKDGKIDEEKPSIKLLILTIVSTLYEKRVFTVDKGDEKLQYTLKSIMRQIEFGGE